MQYTVHLIPTITTDSDQSFTVSNLFLVSLSSSAIHEAQHIDIHTDCIQLQFLKLHSDLQLFLEHLIRDFLTLPLPLWYGVLPSIRLRLYAIPEQNGHFFQCFTYGIKAFVKWPQ